jgi:DNA-binding NtrC family response regulator
MAVELQERRIMIVDDQPDILETLERFLKKWQLNVDAFLDPISALKQFEEHAVDYEIVVSDIKMPGMDGLELANKILQIRSDIKMIFVTAFFTEETDIEKTMLRKDYDVFEKPFKYAKLCERITQLLKDTTRLKNSRFS